nr:MAG TPA: hypothetical protein [Caudoviricetes sp.]
MLLSRPGAYLRPAFLYGQSIHLTGNIFLVNAS